MKATTKIPIRNPGKELGNMAKAARKIKRDWRRDTEPVMQCVGGTEENPTFAVVGRKIAGHSVSLKSYARGSKESYAKLWFDNKRRSRRGAR